MSMCRAAIRKALFVKASSAAAIVAGAFMLLLAQAPLHAAGYNGEAEFKKHCAACHAGGGNSVKPDKTLSRTDREKHGIKTAQDIVRLMRKPGEGMTAFDKAAISDKEAKAIAAYILKTFK